MIADHRKNFNKRHARQGGGEVRVCLCSRMLARLWPGVTIDTQLSYFQVNSPKEGLCRGRRIDEATSRVE